MSKLFSFRHNYSSLRFCLTPWQFQNVMFVPMKANIDAYHERWPTGEEVLFRGFRQSCLWTVLSVKVCVCVLGGGRGRLRDLRMANGLVDAENQKGFDMTTGILEAGSTGTQILPMASNKVLPEMLIHSWLIATSETYQHRLDFLSTASFGAFV